MQRGWLWAANAAVVMLIGSACDLDERPALDAGVDAGIADAGADDASIPDAGPGDALDDDAGAVDGDAGDRGAEDDAGGGGNGGGGSWCGGAASCVTESEPNDDGEVSAEGGLTDGNDFSAEGADGPFSSDVYVEAFLSPAGDEDVFAVANTGEESASVTVTTFGLDGPGTCDGNSYMHVRDASGTSLAEADDHPDAEAPCAGITYEILAGETVYVHVFDYGDNDVYPYWLLVDFP